MAAVEVQSVTTTFQETAPGPQEQQSTEPQKELAQEVEAVAITELEPATEQPKTEEEPANNATTEQELESKEVEAKVGAKVAPHEQKADDVQEARTEEPTAQDVALEVTSVEEKAVFDEVVALEEPKEEPVVIPIEAKVAEVPKPAKEATEASKGAEAGKSEV